MRVLTKLGRGDVDRSVLEGLIAHLLATYAPLRSQASNMYRELCRNHA
jgi:hypothetical protein